MAVQQGDIVFGSTLSLATRPASPRPPLHTAFSLEGHYKKAAYRGEKFCQTNDRLSLVNCLLDQRAARTDDLFWTYMTETRTNRTSYNFLSHFL